jgi:hypothetical protein
MFGEEKNLKDSQKTSSKDTFFIPTLYGQTEGFHLGSYTKTHKLITALYMVTDIIDKEEPLRHKLRTLGTGIISDMHLVQQNNTGYTMSFIFNKVSEIMYFLDIASSVNIISEMNCNILRKEFFELNESVKASIDKDEIADRHINLSEFFNEEPSLPKHAEPTDYFKNINGHLSPQSVARIGHHNSTSIGVQKGSTLMKALSGVKLSSGPKTETVKKTNHPTFDVFEATKKQRQDSIINIIKSIGTGGTIKDIKDKINLMPEQGNSLMSVSEKTLQRELVSMVKNGVLNKTGEKRWSKYFVK